MTREVSRDNPGRGDCWLWASLDPDSGELTRLYHPRKDRWEDHFHRDGAFILGHTDVGRTTAWLLRFNDADNLSQRLLLLELGELD